MSIDMVQPSALAVPQPLDTGARRFLSYVVGAMFAVGGLLVLGVLRRLAKQNPPVR